MNYEYSLDRDETPCQAICARVAAAENCSPVELPPLGDSFDPDSLNTLVRGDSAVNELSLYYCGYEVTITADEIRLAPAEND